MMRLALAMLALALVVTAAWPVHYHLSSNGGWWRDRGRPNWYGRNLMGLAGVLALMLAFTLAGVFLPHNPFWRAVYLWASVVLYAGVAVVVGHRHVLLWRSQHRTR